jgi:hypothetical protein
VDRLDKHFRHLTKAAFSRYGFAYGDVLAQWSAIVGDEHGRVSAPERIRWPRAAPADGETRKAGGTMILRVAEGRALEFQHLVPKIIERINSFYGYEAVTAIKIVQGTVAPPAREAPRLPEVADEAVITQVSAIEDDGLRAALLRLGSALSLRGAASQHSIPPTRTPS